MDDWSGWGSLHWVALMVSILKKMRRLLVLLQSVMLCTIKSLFKTWEALLLLNNRWISYRILAARQHARVVFHHLTYVSVCSNWFLGLVLEILGKFTKILYRLIRLLLFRNVSLGHLRLLVLLLLLGFFDYSAFVAIFVIFASLLGLTGAEIVSTNAFQAIYLRCAGAISTHFYWGHKVALGLRGKL